MLAEASQSNPRGSGGCGGESIALSSRGRLIRTKRRQEEVEEFPDLVLSSRTSFGRETPDELAHGDYASDTDPPRPVKARRAQSMSVMHEGNEARTPSAFVPTSRRATPSDSGWNKAGGIFKTAAVQVLRQTGRLMCTGDITKAAVTLGFINVQGKTPDATMASALYTDIKRKEGNSIFIKPHEGLFGLREWMDKGHSFEDAHERVEPDAGAISPFQGQPCIGRGKVSQAHGPDTRTVDGSPTRTKRPARGGGSGVRRKPGRIEAVRSFSVPSKLSPGRRFAGNMDVLFAAVDEVARDEGTPASSDSAEAALRVSSAIHSPSATPDGQTQPEAGKPFAPPFLGDSRTELRSCSSSEAAVSPADVATATAVSQSETDADPHGQEALEKLTAAARAELVVQTLEASPGVDPALLMQAYMQLCKLCGEAGMLEKACSSLARAMEIGEWTRPS